MRDAQVIIPLTPSAVVLVFHPAAMPTDDSAAVYKGLPSDETVELAPFENWNNAEIAKGFPLEESNHEETLCLWYDYDTDEAARFYAPTFPDSAVGAVHRAPSDFPGGKVRHGVRSGRFSREFGKFGPLSV